MHACIHWKCKWKDLKIVLVKRLVSHVDIERWYDR